MNFIVNYEVNHSSINSPSSIVFHYCLVEDVDMAYYTMTNSLFNAEIKTLKLHCIFFGDALFKPMKVKGDGSCLEITFATCNILYCLDDVWTGRSPPKKKPGIKSATHEVVNDLKQFISQKGNVHLKIFLATMPHKALINLSRKSERSGICNDINRNELGTWFFWWCF